VLLLLLLVITAAAPAYSTHAFRHNKTQNELLTHPSPAKATSFTSTVIGTRASLKASSVSFML
jgi:hypothetical protein